MSGWWGLGPESCAEGVLPCVYTIYLTNNCTVNPGDLIAGTQLLDIEKIEDLPGTKKWRITTKHPFGQLSANTRVTELLPLASSL